MKRTIIAIILLSAFSCCLGNNRFEVYRNKNISLIIIKDIFEIRYNYSKFLKIIGKGVIKEKNSIITCTDMKDGRKMELKPADKYRLKITDMNDYLIQINSRNWFKTDAESLQLIRLNDSIKDDIFYVSFKDNQAYIGENGYIRWIIDSSKNKRYNSVTKKWEKIERDPNATGLEDDLVEQIIESDY